jgi:hypothetical protein
MIQALGLLINIRNIISLNGFLKITRIGTVMIPDRHKTFSTVLHQYHVDTGIVLVMILDVLLIPADTKFVRYCLELVRIVKYYKSIVR